MSDTQGTTPEATPAGVPVIPAGAQLGGEGTAQNQQQAPAQTSYITGGGQEPPVAPQAAPEAPPAPSTETVHKNPYGDKPEEVTGGTYIETSIKHLSGELGITDDQFESVYENALKHGDLSLINPHALGKELTPEQVQRVQQLATAAVQETQAGVARATQEVYSVAGGEAQWNTAVQAFNANAPEDAQGYAGYLADQGKFKQAAEYVLNYNKQGGFVNTVAQPPLQGGNGSTQTGLSLAEYRTEIGKIEQEAGNRSLGSPEFAARIADLDSRRTLGRQQGR